MEWLVFGSNFPIMHRYSTFSLLFSFGTIMSFYMQYTYKFWKVPHGVTSCQTEIMLLVLLMVYVYLKFMFITIMMISSSNNIQCTSFYQKRPLFSFNLWFKDKQLLRYFLQEDHDFRCIYIELPKWQIWTFSHIKFARFDFEQSQIEYFLLS